MDKMENLGSILKRIAGTRRDPGPGEEPPENPPPPACPKCGDAGWLTRKVAVGHPDFGEAFPCSCQQPTERKKADVLRRYSNLAGLESISLRDTRTEGPNGGAADPARFAKALKAAAAYAEKPEGWLVLDGPSGSGKTHLAAAVANRCMERGMRVYYIAAPDLLDHLRGAYGPNAEVAYDTLFEQVRNVPLLVLDDLATRDASPWAEQKLGQILNHRFNGPLPTVITVHGPVEELAENVRTRVQGLGGVARTFSLADHGSRLARELVAQPLANLASMSLQAFDINAGRTAMQREALLAAHTAARRLATGDEPPHWLLLSGPRGCGKTHLAAGIELEWVRQGRDTFHAFVPALLDHLRQTYAPGSRISYDDLFRHIREVPLLVLDDLGTESQSSWTDEKLYQLIVHRHDHRLPTVVTTVFTLPELEKINERVASRLVDVSLVKYVVMLGPNYRTFSRTAQASGRNGGQ